MYISWTFIFCIVLHHRNFATGIVTSVSINGDDSVVEGKSITLKCVATCNNSTCTFKWNGPYLPSITSQPNLLLDKVNRNYSNKSYTCVVTDSGDNNRKEAKTSFVVFYGPDTVSIAAGPHLNVTVGVTYSSYDVSCKASNCYPPCNTFKWTKLRESTPISTQTRLFKIDKDIQKDDAGSYSCSASNDKSEPKTAPLTITVNYPPTVRLTWLENEKKLKCQAEGVPNNYDFQRIKQFMDTTFLKSYDVIQTDATATLTFKENTYQMTGKYICYVTNGIGSLQSGSISLKIEDKPQVVKHINHYNVSKGKNLDVNVELYSFPTVTKSQISVKSTSGRNPFIVSELKNKTVNVTFHGIPLDMPGQELVLSLKEALEEHFTNFTITIGNNFGSMTTDIIIYPEGPPDIPIIFSKSDTSPHSVSFLLVTGFFNGGGQTIVVEHRSGQSEWLNGTTKYAGEEKNKSMIVAVKRLDPETTYEFRAYAFNEYDCSNYTDVIKETTSAEERYTGAIVGGVIGAILLLVIIAGPLVWIRRKKRKEPNSGTYIKRNTDLTLKMPTSPEYENNYRSDQTMFTDEPGCPVTPDQPSNIYENTKLKTGDNVDSIPSYLDLNNPNTNLVEEAYVDVTNPKGKPRLNKQGTSIDDDYLDMNEVNKIKESPYVNAKRASKPSEHLDNGCNKDEKDYQNVEHYKKSKGPPAVAKNKKPNKKANKEVNERIADTEEESKDYQNIEKYKQIPKQPSLESNELYMTMSTESKRESAISLPGFHAPPPPTVLEEEYMNIQIGKGK
ncbi:protein turtle homolog B-like isoform X4 [Ruditapes philippinarum]|uniref:protein turtle homolog B-like isoform X4 n=1 Tax=Ruditapes philippinarum TaxID=129788 RepID=UPI00295A59C3|nr:protein turtle homolog B-like isoform X4 [Ruditapes philippinarum]